jgi:hypothetical protein
VVGKAGIAQMTKVLSWRKSLLVTAAMLPFTQGAVALAADAPPAKSATEVGEVVVTATRQA